MKRVFMTLIGLSMMVSTMASNFVKVVNGRFVRGGKPYCYMGTNFWYGPLLGMEGKEGNRQRLCKELDAMHQLGLDNLRILVGADGDTGVEDKIAPVLQTKPGVYNDSILAGLDYLLSEMSKRKMVAVLYLTNSWEWSGGYGAYLDWAGKGPVVIPRRDGYGAYTKFASQFASNQRAHLMLYEHIRYILSRTNRYTGVRYVDDPTIMSWQLCNEPRAFSKDALSEFEKWLSEASALIRSLDSNHLISLGSEGFYGCELDYGSYERICADKNIDYCNIHIWPYNWQWARKDYLKADLKTACDKTLDYIKRHLAIAKRLNKPLVLEEFGYPRDGFSFSLNSSTKARDAYYKYVMSLIVDYAAQGSVLQGCNFWGWGGFAQPKHERWQAGDDFTCDPAHEPQGFYSVFASDKSTQKIIQQQAKRMATVK